MEAGDSSHRPAGHEPETSMIGGDERLLAILRIARNTSARGRGLSLREALAQAGYETLRPSLSASGLRPLLDADLVADWLAHSQDKRTSGGWYLLESGEIGRVDSADVRLSFRSLEEAVAEYVVRELEFWAGVDRG